MKKYNQPLGMPEGSVRASIAILVNLGTIIYCIITKSISTELLTLTGLIDGYYFAKRSDEGTMIYRETPADTSVTPNP